VGPQTGHRSKRTDARAGRANDERASKGQPGQTTATGCEIKVQLECIADPGASSQPQIGGLAAHWYLLLFMPSGLAQGFVNVTLSYLLGLHGVSVAVIAGVISLYMLPSGLRFVFGPILDVGLSSPRWYLVCLGTGAACLAALGFTPLTAEGVPILNVLALASGVAFMGSQSSATAAMVLTTPVEARGEVAGWTQAGYYGGIGAGGGVGLWLCNMGVSPAGAAVGLTILCLLCGAPILRMRAAPRPAGVPISHQALEFGRALRALVTTRTGVLVLFVVTMPAGLGSAINLMATVAGDWGASANMVAWVLGALSGMINVPGCVFGGYLCKLLPSRTAYVVSCLACAAAEAALALGPHTPTGFSLFILLNTFLIGIAASTSMAVICASLDARATAAMSSVLLSLLSLPAVIMTALVGWVQSRNGSAAMLLVEAVIGAVSVGGYALLLWLWRPQSKIRLEVAPLVGSDFSSG
jgi:MFS transporter, PAT family, beta-lactamase induction signal transducer AmpG